FVRDLKHRGPDGDGTKVLEAGEVRVGLAHARLAILDLSPAGAQPMERDGLWIAFNGEIYNHLELRKQLPPCPYRSTSDTETILCGWRTWGADLLPRLEGMFAFALFDARARELWLARDPLGIKPLYVAETPAGVAFASEVRALLNANWVPPRLDRDGLESYLAFGAAIAPRTLVAGVESVMPGSAWRISCEREPRPIEKRRFWNPPTRTEPMTREDAVRKLRPLLARACESHMLSDVPVGAFLSGGIDSSAVVATLAAAGKSLDTFSVTFGEKRFDESRYAAAVAKKYGTRHHELPLSPAAALADYPAAIAAYDQPSLDGVNTWFVARVTRAAGATVALSGLGGDEFFAGYPYFRWADRIARLPSPARRALALGLKAAGARPRYRKLAALAAADGPVDRYLACRTLFDERTRRVLVPNAANPTPAEWRAEAEEWTRELDPVAAHSLLEASHYMANTLLRDGDQMSMAHALEVRVPLLDRPLVEAAARIPGRLRLERGSLGPIKGLLVDSVPTPLPREIVDRPKMGFVLPFGKWLRGELRDFAAETMEKREIWEGLGFDPGSVNAVWTRFLEGRGGDRPTEAMALLHLGSWAARHRVRS
ncbi:MAG TPA: asparagine synthase (glutamine-hydrolyzing), partial [Planctomycetia bacterium]|nr:asparagine synthase (glutamine-hydrolyzing) [Planctomycetia bacterium]